MNNSINEKDLKKFVKINYHCKYTNSVKTKQVFNLFFIKKHIFLLKYNKNRQKAFIKAFICKKMSNFADWNIKN